VTSTTPSGRDAGGGAAGDRRVQEVLRRLELDVGRRLDGLLQGDFRGLVSGLGSEPGETRAYTPGDDVRRMDWNVTARTTEPHVRESIADRELATTVLVDLSPSLHFGTAVRTKAELAIAAVAAVGILTDRVGNRLGAIVADGTALHTVRSGSGRRHLMALLHRLSTTEPQRSPAGDDRDGTHGLPEGLRRIAGPGYRGGLAVVVSDLLGDGWADPLRAASLRHDSLVIEIVDPRELELPPVGIIELVDAETGEVREVDTRSRKLRDRYAEAGRARLTDHAAAVRRAGADHLVLRTDRDWVIDLARFVDRRRRSRRRPSATNPAGVS
jgi:uncharacterized protein (DUF58 family)